ncbi:hypothetical protein [uncultured Algibacter sp.]|uniref:hypothetical protein n=1 Tax=uncultured Algibacter sp. TaxID=298659 RepID=UPI00260EFD4E|nr:hypothetical protein [uncultured Algibacter sp.]
MNKYFSFLIVFLITFATSAQNFTTEGNAIRHTVTASVKGKSVLYIGELDGSVSSYNLKGNKLWSHQNENPAVLFEIEASDINNDGNDDLITANANGTINCYDSSGKLLWTFTSNHKVRFSEVAVVKNNNKIQIFAGGNDYILYELDSKGQLVSETKIDGVVRKIEAGNFLEANKQSLFLMTYSHDKFRWEFLGFLDAETKEVIKSVGFREKRFKNISKAMVTDIQVSDINKDNKDDVLFFADLKFGALFTALDSDFNVLAEFQASRKDLQRYAHSQGAFLPSRNEIMFQHGGILFVLDTKGNLIEKSGKRYGSMVYCDFAFEPKTNKLIAGGEVDGGNAIYFYDLNDKNWFKTVHIRQGRMSDVQENINTLYNQILDFEMPDYQKKPDKEWIMITSKVVNSKVENLKGQDVKFVIQRSPKEGTDRSHLVAKIGKIALKKDKRGKYKDTREDIVNMARKFEAEGQPFTFWAGHGNDPFYIQIETLEQILEVAPNTCYGFVYAEMANDKDPRVIHFIREYMPRLAKAMRVNGKAKLYFRYKNMFWAATSHLPVWKELFFSGKYTDILVPASEDTSNRTQDLNLVGRVGMLKAGYVDDFAMRLIDDNPTSWRPLSPGGQNSISPYLRQGVIMAAYGARYGVVANNSFTEDPGLNVLFGLMKSGVLPIVEKENMQSIGSWHLIKNVSEELIHSVDSHHNLKMYNENDDDAVFSYSQMHWAGTNIPEYDFSKAALGVKYRWLNYMPEMPHGMVPIAPFESQSELKNQNIPFSVSNAKVGFDGEKSVSAIEFGETIKSTVKKGEKALPIVVKGASWSLIKIDDNHSRLILVDSGYIDPQEREAKVIFQNIQPKSVIDILSKENLILKDEILELTVPAGSIRVIDVAY